jgi:hypothetical protein
MFAWMQLKIYLSTPYIGFNFLETTGQTLDWGIFKILWEVFLQFKKSIKKLLTILLALIQIDKLKCFLNSEKYLLN